MTRPHRYASWQGPGRRFKSPVGALKWAFNEPKDDAT